MPQWNAPVQLIYTNKNVEKEKENYMKAYHNYYGLDVV
jgi:hypothetical protein